MTWSGMEWWQSFWGWLITVVLAGIAAAGVVLQEVRRLRHRVSAQVSSTEISRGDLGPTPIRLFALSNVGNAPATSLRLMFRGAEQIFPDRDKYVVPDVLKPHESARFAVVDRDLDSAYLVLMWIHRPRRNQRHEIVVRWHPLLGAQSPLAAEQERQWAEHKPERFHRRRRRAHTHVGPGGVPEVRLRSDEEERLLAALQEPPATDSDPEPPAAG